MQTLRFVPILLATLFGFVLSQTEFGVDTACISCICDAVSECNMTTGCKNGTCGPFGLSLRYWLDVGMPLKSGDNVDNEQAFQNCALDPPCASDAVKEYVKKFKQDCDKDGSIDCRDYARVYYLGGTGCSSRPLDENYERRLEACLTQSNQITR